MAKSTVKKPLVTITIDSFSIQMDPDDLMTSYAGDALADSITEQLDKAVKGSAFTKLLDAAIQAEIKNTDFVKLAKKALANAATKAMGGK